MHDATRNIWVLFVATLIWSIGCGSGAGEDASGTGKQPGSGDEPAASVAEPLMLGGWATGRSDQFVRSGDNKLYHRYTDPVSEHGWMYIGDNGVPLASDPAVASWGAGRADLFVINQNNTIDHGVVYGDGDAFAWTDNWDSPHPGYPLTGIDVASSRRGLLDLIVVSAAYGISYVWHRRWDNGNDTGWQHWGDWVTLNALDSPAIASGTFGIEGFDVFLTARTSTSSPYSIFHAFTYNGVAVSAWENLGVPAGTTLVSGVDAASWGGMRMDVVVTGANGAVVHAATENRVNWYWDTWAGFPAVNNSPSIVAMGPQRLRVFARSASDATMVQCKWDAGATSCSNLGGWLWGGPDASSWGSPFPTNPNDYVRNTNPGGGGAWGAPWTHGLQGIAHDNNGNWVWVNEKRIFLTRLNEDTTHFGDWLGGFPSGADSDIYFGGGWAKWGNQIGEFHFGDPDFYNGHLFVPIELHTGESWGQFIAIYNSAPNYNYHMSLAVSAQPMPEQLSFAWLAINPKDGLLYTSTTFSNVTALKTYDISPSLVLTPHGTVPLRSYDGVGGITIPQIQGGAFSPNGHLYVSDGVNLTIYVFDVDGTLHNTIAIPYSGAQEVEGMDILDMSPYPLSGMLGAQIHNIQMLDFPWPWYDPMWFHHWKTSSPLY
jgi:hypothetical protein